MTWRSTAGGRSTAVGEAKRPKALEDENRRLKQLVAKQQLDTQALKTALGKGGEAPRPTTLGCFFEQALSLSRQRACRRAGISRSVMVY